MAFAYSKFNPEKHEGSLLVTTGSFTNGGGDIGGDIYTGLPKVDGMILMESGGAVVADKSSVYETFPCHDPVTIVTTAGADGLWMAWMGVE